MGPWPGTSIPPGLLTTLVDAASSLSPVSPTGLVAHVSHPFYGGQRRSEWQLDLFPSSAVPILEETHPAALVIDASSALWGSPWAGAGSEVDPARTWGLVELIRTAGRSGVATIFRWDLPVHQVPLLRRIAAECDVIVSAGRGMTAEDLPLLPHGVKMTGGAEGGPRLAIFSNSSPFAPDLPDPRPLHRFADRDAEVIPTRLLHDPSALGRLLGTCSLALFPPSSEPTLVVLEALERGLAVVGPSGPDLPNLHASPTVLGEDFFELVAARRPESVVKTRRSLHQEHSTVAEARRIGLLVGNSDLAGMVANGDAHD